MLAEIACVKLCSKTFCKMTLLNVAFCFFDLMKKIILLAGITMFFLASSSFAMNPGLFTYDKAAIETEI